MRGRGITISDVAREAGVSAQTVSRVLNDKREISAPTRERVVGVIERLGYRPNSVARSLVSNRTFAIGLTVPDICNPFFPDIARGAEDTAREHGYEVFLCNTIEDPGREEAVLRALENRRVDGAVVCSSRLPDGRLLPWLERQRAAVLVNRPAPSEAAGSVRMNDASGTTRAVEHLLDGGRRVIGFLAGPARSHSRAERSRGYERALAGAGIQPDPGLTVPCDPTVEGGYEGALALLAEHSGVDGLVCYNDLVAVGALRAFGELGVRVPGDVAVVGCDDIMLAGLVSPALTTLRAPKYEIGAQAVGMLLEHIDGRRDRSEVILDPELVVRASAPHGGRETS
jgi:LacI family transcriptional regulator